MNTRVHLFLLAGRAASHHDLFELEKDPFRYSYLDRLLFLWVEWEYKILLALD